MAVRPIRISGEPVLHTPAEEVTAFDGELRELVRDLFETMDAAPGVGLAAPQVGIPLRVFVYGYTDESEVAHRGVAVNPVLWNRSIRVGTADEESEAEGCLSFPGERFPLVRASESILEAVDEAGSPVTMRASGWLARILQHEYDHLDGILYVDRLEHAHARRAAKALRKNGWGNPGLTWQPGVDHPEG